MLEEQTGTLKNMQDSLYSPCIQYMYGTSQQPVEPEENTIGTAQLWDRLLAWGARALESLFRPFSWWAQEPKMPQFCFTIENLFSIVFDFPFVQSFHGFLGIFF